MEQAVTIPDMANGTGICTCIIYYIGERWSTFVVGLQVIRIWIDLVSVLSCFTSVALRYRFW